MTIPAIIRLTAAHFRLTPEELTAHSRLRRIARPRQVAMRLACEQGRWSLTNIGRRFGGFDHTTVLYARDWIAALEAAGEPRVVEALAVLRPQVRALLAAGDHVAKRGLAQAGRQLERIEQ